MRFEPPEGHAGRLEHGWQRPGQAQAQQLFDPLDLKGAFWGLGGKR